MTNPSRCRSCGDEIIWLKTESGKNMPVNAPLSDPGDSTETIFDPCRHISHFATCPNADQHRKPR